LEPDHGSFRGVDVADQDAFRQFKLEPRRIEFGFGERAFDGAAEVGAAELQWRDVDRDRQPRPGLAVNAGAAQHPGAELDDQSGMFGGGDEFAWRDFAARRMRPAAE